MVPTCLDRGSAALGRRPTDQYYFFRSKISFSISLDVQSGFRYFTPRSFGSGVTWFAAPHCSQKNQGSGLFVDSLVEFGD